MRYNVTNKEEIYVDECQTRHFIIKRNDDKFEVVWHKHVLDAIKQPRYIGWFSAIDLVRINAETIINAQCSKETNINQIGNIINRSIEDDYYCNHIVQQCFSELSL